MHTNIESKSLYWIIIIIILKIVQLKEKEGERREK